MRVIPVYDKDIQNTPGDDFPVGHIAVMGEAGDGEESYSKLVFQVMVGGEEVLFGLYDSEIPGLIDALAAELALVREMEESARAEIEAWSREQALK